MNFYSFCRGATYFGATALSIVPNVVSDICTIDTAHKLGMSDSECESNDFQLLPWLGFASFGCLVLYSLSKNAGAKSQIRAQEAFFTQTRNSIAHNDTQGAHRQPELQGRYGADATCQLTANAVASVISLGTVGTNLAFKIPVLSSAVILLFSLSHIATARKMKISTEGVQDDLRRQNQFMLDRMATLQALAQARQQAQAHIDRNDAWLNIENAFLNIMYHVYPQALLEQAGNLMYNAGQRLYDTGTAIYNFMGFGR